jgi:polygalacturonase
MWKTHLAAVLLFAAGCAAAGGPMSQIATSQSAITDFGAVGDGTTLNTAAIQSAIDHIAAEGGGTVVVPPGVFLSGSIFLKPGVNLHLDKDAVLKGTTDINDYPNAMTRIEGHFQVWRSALVNADHCDHLRIDGQGTLDGSGQPFWLEFRQRIAANRRTTNLDVPRPRLIFIRDSNDVQVSGIHLKDSGFWNLHLYRCQNVLVDGLDISAGARSPSTDGIDIDSSQNITVHACHFAVNDDCIALKGSKGPFALKDADSPPVEHIRVSDCTVSQGPCIITCGSEATIVRDVVVEHCSASGPGTRNLSVLRLKLRPDTPQTYEDIHIHDVTLDGSGSLIAVAPWLQYFDLQGQPPPTGSISNVSFSDIKGTCNTLGSIRGNKGDSIDGITFENIDITTHGPKPQLSTVKNLTVTNVQINGAAFSGGASP